MSYRSTSSGSRRAGGHNTLFAALNDVVNYAASLNVPAASCSRGTSTPPSYSFNWADGTSMAAPAASSVAALEKQSHPGISLGALKTLLARIADDEGKNGNDPHFGRGFLNTYGACTTK